MRTIVSIAALVALCSMPVVAQGSRDIVPSDDYFDTSTLPVTATPISFAGWFYADSFSGNAHRIFNIASGGTTHFIRGMGWNTGALYCTVNDGTSKEAFVSSISSGVWTFFACTLTSTTKEAHVNAAKASISTSTGSLSGLTYQMVGRLVYAGTPYNETDGKVAHFGLWDTEITDEQVASMRHGRIPLMVERGALRGYYSFQENGSGDNAGDQSRENNHMTANSSPPAIADGPPVYLIGSPP